MSTELSLLARITQTWVRQRPAAASDDGSGVRARRGWDRFDAADLVAVIAIAAQLVWRALLESGAVLRQDDFLLATQAHRTGLSVVFDDYHGHVQVVGWIVAWLANLIAPMQHWPLAVIIVGLQAIASVLSWLAIRALVGARPIALLGLAVALFSPLTIGALMWAAAAIQLLTLEIAILAGVLAHLRATRKGTTASIAVAWLVVAVGLLANEKALVVPIVILCLVGVSSLQQLRDSLRTDRTLWMGYAALMTGETILYLSISRSDNFQPAGAVGVLARDGFLGTWLPQLTAVPIAGDVWPPLLRPPAVSATILAILAVVVVVVFATTRTGYRALLALVLLVAYGVGDYAVIAASRLGFGNLIALDTRYVADTVPVAALCLALAVTSHAGDRPWRIGRVEAVARRGRVASLTAVCVAVAAYAACAIPATSASADANRRAGNPAYVSRVRAELSGRSLTLVNNPVPDDVVSTLFGADARLSELVAVLPGHRLFSGVTAQPYLVDATGHLRAAAPGPGSLRRTGPQAGCGWPVVSGGQRTIPLPDPLLGGPGIVSIGYVLGAPTPVTITVGRQVVSLKLRPGLAHLSIVVASGAGPITASGIISGAQLCISDVTVGAAAPQ